MSMFDKDKARRAAEFLMKLFPEEEGYSVMAIVIQEQSAGRVLPCVLSNLSLADQKALVRLFLDKIDDAEADAAHVETIYLPS
jgi:hypothetical protein